MTGDKLRRDHRGLTLMELLVVMGIFSLTVTMTSAIFIQSNRAQRRVLALNAAQADLRFALEAIVREVRGGQIDYATYAGSGGVQVPSDNLIIKSASGSKLKFYAETNPTVCPSGVAKCLAVNVDGQAQSVTASGITLLNATFYISPQADPFSIDAASGLYKSDAQPLVTIALKIKAPGTAGTVDAAVLSAQTTVASRLYAR
jgi:prepilin-type N-terminal cleavage/methylation domain-containing protein